MRQEKVCLDGLSLIKVCMIKWQNEFVRVLDQQIKIKKKIKSFLRDKKDMMKKEVHRFDKVNISVQQCINNKIQRE